MQLTKLFGFLTSLTVLCVMTVYLIKGLQQGSSSVAYLGPISISLLVLVLWHFTKVDHRPMDGEFAKVVAVLPSGWLTPDRAVLLAEDPLHYKERRFTIPLSELPHKNQTRRDERLCFNGCRWVIPSIIPNYIPAD